MAEIKIEQMPIRPTGKPKADKARMKELVRQKAPKEKNPTLPINEGYSKTFLRVIIVVSTFLFAITLAGALGINTMFEIPKSRLFQTSPYRCYRFQNMRKAVRI